MPTIFVVGNKMDLVEEHCLRIRWFVSRSFREKRRWH
jgi:hypothetical protein